MTRFSGMEIIPISDRKEYYWISIQNYEQRDIPFHLYHDPQVGQEDVELVALKKCAVSKRGVVRHYDSCIVLSLFYRKDTKEILTIATEDNLAVAMPTQYAIFLKEIMHKLNLKLKPVSHYSMQE